MSALKMSALPYRQMIYADYNSTAPVLKSVAEVMQPYLAECFGNPAADYCRLGVVARDALEEARLNLARLLSANGEEVVFLSGGTESCFHALMGAYLARPEKKHIITSAVEHAAVLRTVELLERPPFNCQVTYLAVDRHGVVCLDELAKAILPKTGIVSIMLANNETGVVMPIARIAEVCRQSDIVLHTDAVQAVGKMPVNFRELDVDLLSVSGHKFGAPKGIGALLVRDAALWRPVVVGGGQENGRRGGTPAVALAVGLGQAAVKADVFLSENGEEKLLSVLEAFESCLRKEISGCFINGSGATRLSNTSSVVFGNIIAKQLVENLSSRNIVISAGAACSAAKLDPSHVLRAMGLSDMECMSTARISFGPNATLDEAVSLAKALAEEVNALRNAAKDEVSRRLC